MNFDEASEALSALGLSLPSLGSYWVWEPEKTHARELLEVFNIRWTGENFWIEARGIVSLKTHAIPFDRWTEATVLDDPIPRPLPAPAGPTRYTDSMIDHMIFEHIKEHPNSTITDVASELSGQNIRPRYNSIIERIQTLERDEKIRYGLKYELIPR